MLDLHLTDAKSQESIESHEETFLSGTLFRILLALRFNAGIDFFSSLDSSIETDSICVN